MQEFQSLKRFEPEKMLLRAAIVASAMAALAIGLGIWRPILGLAMATLLLAFAAFMVLLRHAILAAPKHVTVQPNSPPLAEGLASNQLLEHLPVALLRIRNDGQIEFGNAEARQLLGRTDLKNSNFSDFIEGLSRTMPERILEATQGNSGRTTEMGRCMRDGVEVFLQVSLMEMSYDLGKCCIAVLTDKTELKTLEAQFVQSQKMEAVGQLAGGIAHDFNNLLTAINGHSDLLLLRHKSGDEDYGDLIQIRQNSLRAAALVKQLLAFSRKQTLRPKVVNLVDVIKNLSTLLNRLLGEKVSLAIDDYSKLKSVRIDVQQFEQVIMNLVVNARDAMPMGGQVLLSAQNITLDQPITRCRATVPSGDYVLVSVKDEGCGIPVDTLPKIFEPFFTTKRIGEGTGLGLSTVYGIIKQTGGFVFATSAENQGTQFDIYLPIHAQEVLAAQVAPQATVTPAETKNSERILLVEDEEPVRSFAARALKLQGYIVDEAEDGEAALKTLKNCARPYDLFISDVIMPGLNGPSWIRKAKESGHQTKVIFMSGYSEEAFADSKRQINDAAFLAKPFSLNGLTALVAEVLESL